MPLNPYLDNPLDISLDKSLNIVVFPHLGGDIIIVFNIELSLIIKGKIPSLHPFTSLAIRILIEDMCFIVLREFSSKTQVPQIPTL